MEKSDCHKNTGKHEMCENKFEQDRENHPGLVKITVAKHYVDPWYVKIYCNKNNDVKENVKLTKESLGECHRSKKNTKCVKQCGHAARLILCLA